MTPQEVLEKAAANIAEHGHQKGTYGSRQHGFCAIGAIRYAATDGYGVHLADLSATKTQDVATKAEAMLILELAKGGWRCPVEMSLVPTFNDDPHTTPEDVMLMMKRAAHG